MSRKKVRTSRRRAALRRNPLSKKGKILAVGGIAVAGTAAYLLLGSSLASAQPPPTGPLPEGGGTGDPKVDKIAECQALAQNLARLRTTSADAGTISQAEAQLAACIAEARQMAAEIPPDMAALSDGESGISYVDSKFGEYKATAETDAVKRNNLRVNEVLGRGAAMAASLATAVSSSTSDATTNLARSSIVRAIESSVNRRLCYLYDQPGCGRFGVNEDHGNDKASQEQSRILTPLMTAHAASVSKLGGPTSAKLSSATTDKFLLTLLNSCKTTKSYVDAKFNEYKSVTWDDAVRRNNLRQEVLRHGGDLVACLRSTLQEAQTYRSKYYIRATSDLIAQSLDAAATRQMCYWLDQQGCGRLGVNEDHGNDKARQEYDRTVKPLTDLANQAAAELFRLGDPVGYQSLAKSKVATYTILRNWVTAKFNEYKSVTWDDAVRRNNLRVGETLDKGGGLLSLLKEAAAAATAGAVTPPPPPAPPAPPKTATATVSPTALATLKAPLTSSTVKLPLTTSLTLRGLGATGFQLSTFNLTNIMKLDFVPPQAAAEDPVQILKLVADAGVQGVSDSYNRYLCFLLQQGGCGTFGVNEDDTWKKADQEKDKILNPLSDEVLKIAKLMATKGNGSSLKALVDAQVAACRAISNRMNEKFGELKGVDYMDPVRRNNIRNDILRWGQNLVSWLTRTASFAGTDGIPKGDSQVLLRTVNEMAVAALGEAMKRRQCFLSDAPGCGKIGDEANLLVPGISLIEPHSTAKAAEELNKIITPLLRTSQDVAVKAAAAGDSGAELALIDLQIRTCVDIANYVDAKWGEYTATSGYDAVKRNNLRNNEIRGKGREMVACFREIKPKTPQGKSNLKFVLDQVLARSKNRENCLRSGQCGTARPWGTANEPHDGERADDEAREIRQPLEALIAGLGSLSGLGQAVESATGLSPLALVGVGAAVLLVGHAAMNRPAIKRNKRLARSRRTSRRASR